MTDDKRFTLNDDAPKKLTNDDRLNYAPFAQKIADAIVQLDAQNGYVIGLHGEWGSGKSTALNFVVEYLKRHNSEHENKRVIPIDFSPWIITGDHDLIAACFKVVAEKLRTTRKRPRRRLFERFGKERTDALVGAVTTLGLTMVDQTQMTTASVVGKSVQKTLSRLTAHYLKTPSLQKAYEALGNELRKSEDRYLVVIDDIDRLRDGEVRSIMQMVKSVGQLPNVIYLLAYDREIVWNSFRRNPTRAEPSFAEKIVQQELQLPVPSKAALLSMFYNEISMVLEGTEDSVRWQHIRQDGLNRWIRSPRDVVRLSNALKFCWPALRNEIDPQDLLAVEGLRLFDFEVFEWLRGNRDYLFTKGRFILADSDLKTRTLASLKDRIPEANWSRIQPLLFQLFPQIGRELKESIYSDEMDSDLVRRRRGIGSEAGYDSYFGLYPSPDAIPLDVVNRLVSGDETAEAIEATLREHIHLKNSQDDPMIEELLGELSIRFRGTNPALPGQPLLDGLFAVGEEISDIDYPLGMIGVRADVQLDRLIREMFCRWGKLEAGARLIEAFEKSESPAFLADVFVSRGRELNVIYPASNDDCPISMSDFEKLGQILMPKIRAAVNDESLVQAPYYYGIARAWGYVSTPDEPKSWLMEGIVQSEEFMAKACLSLVAVSSDRKGNPQFEMMRDPDPAYYDIETLLDAGRAHQFSESLSEEKRDRISAVVRGCEKLLTQKDQSRTE